MLKTYREHVAERMQLGIPPLPLTAEQTAQVIELLKKPPAGEEQLLLELISHRVPAGVDAAAKVKASYLAAVALGTEVCTLISRQTSRAVRCFPIWRRWRTSPLAWCWARAGQTQ